MIINKCIENDHKCMHENGQDDRSINIRGLYKCTLITEEDVKVCLISEIFKINDFARP